MFCAKKCQLQACYKENLFIAIYFVKERERNRKDALKYEFSASFYGIYTGRYKIRYKEIKQYELLSLIPFIYISCLRCYYRK